MADQHIFTLFVTVAKVEGLTFGDKATVLLSCPTCPHQVSVVLDRGDLEAKDMSLTVTGGFTTLKPRKEANSG